MSDEVTRNRQREQQRRGRQVLRTSAQQGDLCEELDQLTHLRWPISGWPISG
jgi:hypothetical protein